MAVGYCMYCGTRFDGDYRFCMGCGRPIADVTSDAASSGVQQVVNMEGQASADEGLRGAASGKGVQEPVPVSTFDLEQIYGRFIDTDEDEDMATKVYVQEVNEDEPDVEDESPTLVFPKGPKLAVRRLGTGVIYSFVPPASIGRGSKCTVRILGNRYISRVHAKIEQVQDGYVLCDTSSSNSTFLNGEVLSGDKRAVLHPGDHIRLADEELVFEGEQKVGSVG